MFQVRGLSAEDGRYVKELYSSLFRSIPILSKSLVGATLGAVMVLEAIIILHRVNTFRFLDVRLPSSVCTGVPLLSTCRYPTTTESIWRCSVVVALKQRDADVATATTRGKNTSRLSAFRPFTVQIETHGIVREPHQGRVALFSLEVFHARLARKMLRLVHPFFHTRLETTTEEVSILHPLHHHLKVRHR